MTETDPISAIRVVPSVSQELPFRALKALGSTTNTSTCHGPAVVFICDHHFSRWRQLVVWDGRLWSRPTPKGVIKGDMQ